MRNESLTFNWWPVAIGAVVLTGVLVALTLSLTGQATLNASNPFWLVGLIVLFGAALTLIATVFRSMGLENREEAFALPSGSIRTLLAIGIMVLFAVFGLTFFSGDGAAVKKLSGESVVDVAAPSDPNGLSAEIKRYEDAGLVVAVLSRGVVGANPVDAKLRLFRLDVSLRAEVTDSKKQVLTAVITLLTTVIGFYFGSRSAESARERADRNNAADGGNPAPPTEPKTFDAELAEATEQLTKLQQASAPAGKEDELKQAVAVAVATGEKLKADRAALAKDMVEQALPGARVGIRVAALRILLAALIDQLAAVRRIAG